ncbi:MAG: pyridinium-3,5-bisthiocarboxylic acid mononucleotide nickel chelatase, partial [Archaeoglobaceae archaeon]|nr:pyridinium-3,5-bisthiocarboxylic acid mononucleotide nickel chelatase [Archaeoglobaceae archaeon]
MRVAIFDAFNGASGDMIISSLLNLALTEEDLKEIRDVLQLKIKFRVEEVK